MSSYKESARLPSYNLYSVSSEEQLLLADETGEYETRLKKEPLGFA